MITGVFCEKNTVGVGVLKTFLEVGKGTRR